MHSPKVSIITPSYNSGIYLPETIESVLAQTFEDWELLIIDDCSTDNTLGIARYYADKDSRIEVMSNETNLGPAKTRNRGIKKANGNYLSFLDSDDVWEKDFLNKSLDFLNKKQCSFSFSSYYRVDEDFEEVHDPFIVPEKVNYSDLLRTCPILCSSVLININKIGKFYMPDIRKRQDYGFFLKILKHIDYAYGNKEKLVTYRIRKGSVSRNKFKAIAYVWRLFREVEGLSFLKSSYLICIYIFNGLKKYSPF